MRRRALAVRHEGESAGTHGLIGLRSACLLTIADSSTRLDDSRDPYAQHAGNSKCLHCPRRSLVATLRSLQSPPNSAIACLLPRKPPRRHDHQR